MFFFWKKKIPVKRAKQPERKIEVKFPANMHISTLCFTYCAKFCIFWSLVKRKCTENYSFVHVSGVLVCSIIDRTLNKSMYTSCLYQLPFFSFKKFCSVFERSFTDWFRSIYLILAKKGPSRKINWYSCKYCVLVIDIQFHKMLCSSTTEGNSKIVQDITEK